MAVTDQKDPLFKYLNEKGYTPISVPEGKMDPPTIYVLEGEAFHVLRGRDNLLSGLKDASGLEVQEAVAVEMEQAMAKKGGGKAGVSFLGGLFAKFGIQGAPEAHAALELGDNRIFSFKRVTSRRVDPGAVLDALKGYSPAKLGKSFLEAEKVYVAYAYLYSSALEVATGDNVKGGAGLKAEASGIGTFEVGLNGEAKSGDEMTAKRPVAFAMRMARLRWNKEYQLDFNMGDTLGAAGTPERAFVPRRGIAFDIAEADLLEPQ